MPVLRFVQARDHRRWRGVALLGAALALACGDSPEARRERAQESAARQTPGTGGTADDFGAPVPVLMDPRRVVSLSPATTELFFALGAGSRLVGRTRWDLYPDSARGVPDLGDGIRPNIEAVLAARPDLVVLYASPENRPAARALRAAGVAVIAVRMDRIGDFARVATLLGNVAHAPERARQVVDSVTRTLAHVRGVTASLARPTVFLFAWENPLITIGAGSYLSELVEIAGGRNVFADMEAPSPQVSFEELLRRDPDVILAGPVTAATLTRAPRWHALSAVRTGRVLVLDTLLTARPGVRLGEAAVSLAQLLHPGVVP